MPELQGYPADPNSGGSATPGGNPGDIQFNNSGVLGGVTKVLIANGGTNAATAAAARTNLGAAASGTNTDIKSLKLNSQFGVSSYNILPSDNLINMASGQTVTLPTNAGAAQAGRSYIVWNSQGTPATLADVGGAITLAGTGTYVYGASITLQPYTVYFVYADNGSSWYALPQATVGGFTVPFATWTDVSAGGGAYVAPMGGAIRFVSSAATLISLPLIGSSPVGSKVIMFFNGGGIAPITPNGSDQIVFQNTVNNSIATASGQYYEFTVFNPGVWMVSNYVSDTGAGDLHPLIPAQGGTGLTTFAEALGNGSLSGGTVTITDAAAATTSHIFIQSTGGGVLANTGISQVTTKNNGSFVVTSTNALDSSNFDYMIKQ